MSEPLVLEYGYAHVEDGDTAWGVPLEASVMGVPVKGYRGAAFVESVSEVTRPEEGVDLRRLAFDRGAYRRVVENGNPPLRL
jgi:hypothetical protein